MPTTNAAKRVAPAEPAAEERTKRPSRLDQITILLQASDGASIAELMDATGWQQHLLRGAMAGALRKRGLAITSDRVDGVRRYFASVA